MLRKIHIGDLPKDRIFILLNKRFHNYFFSVISKQGFSGFNEKVFDNLLNHSTFKQWKRREIKVKERVKVRFLPLWFLIKVSENFPNEFSTRILENNIIAYKGPSSSKIIINPKFPLIEDKRMLKILAHLIGDGYVSGAFGTNLSKGKSHSEYRNFSSILLESFRSDLSVFGEIDLQVNYEHGHVVVPNSIGYILQHFYKIKFDTFNSRLPKSLFRLDKDLIASFIRAFADDEAHVYDSSIEFYSANKNLLEDIKEIIKLTFPSFSLSSVKINSSNMINPKFSFSILSNSFEVYFNVIGFDCPKKIDRMKYSIERRVFYKKYRVNKDNKSLIIKLLKGKSLTSYVIARKLFISHSHSIKVLRSLKKEGLVEDYMKTTHGAFLWRLKL